MAICDAFAHVDQNLENFDEVQAKYHDEATNELLKGYGKTQECLETINRLHEPLITWSRWPMLQGSVSGIDIIDMPHGGVDPSSVKSSFFYGEVASQFQIQEDTEKACLDVSIEPGKGAGFSKVYAVYNQSIVVIEKFVEVVAGSPSKVLKKDPYLGLFGIQSTFRVRTKLLQGCLLGTGFAVSPKLAITAAHVLREGSENLNGKVQLARGDHVSNIAIHQFGEKTSAEIVHHPFELSSREKGLYTKGADLGSVVIPSHFQQKQFLLPCSSSYLKTSQKDVAVFSYPDVDVVLAAASRDLCSTKSDNPIWNAYKPVMEVELYRVANEKCLGHDDPAVVSVVQLKLLDMLVDTFKGFTTGMLLCSVGKLLDDNGTCLSTSCSTLSGSSGGAVVSLAYPGYLLAVHQGGSPNHPFNVATSCDNEHFVEFYCSKVLPSLPRRMNGINLDPFIHWINKHALVVGPELLKLWNSKGMKRKRCLE